MGAVVDDGSTLEADILAHCSSFLLVVTRLTQSSACILEEAFVSEHVLAQFALETARVPVGIHRLDDSTCGENTEL